MTLYDLHVFRMVVNPGLSKSDSSRSLYHLFNIANQGSQASTCEPRFKMVTSSSINCEFPLYTVVACGPLVSLRKKRHTETCMTGNTPKNSNHDDLVSFASFNCSHKKLGCVPIQIEIASREWFQRLL